MHFEGLAGKGAMDILRFGQFLYGLVRGGTDLNGSNPAQPLEVIKRREDLVVHDHTSADYKNFRCHAGLFDFSKNKVKFP